jgi:hypothetical protein
LVKEYKEQNLDVFEQVKEEFIIEFPDLTEKEIIILLNETMRVIIDQKIGEE